LRSESIDDAVAFVSPGVGKWNGEKAEKDKEEGPKGFHQG
jgi:hypothetical protein